MKSNLIVCDAPFPFSDKLTMSSVKRGAEAQYKNTLSIEEIKNLPVASIADEDCLLAFWVPSSLTAEGLDIMKAWGFRFVQTWIWAKTKQKPLADLKKALRKKSKDKLISVKDMEDVLDSFSLNSVLNMKLGRTFRQTHELALIGLKGKIYRHLANKSQRSVDISPLVWREEVQHSAKPETLQDRLEIMFPTAAHPVEMFARRARPGWDCIGNELDKPEDILDGLKRIAES